MNPDKKAIALVIYRSEKKEKVLSVLRPENDRDHPGMWGLPATSLGEDETWEDAVHRAAEEKLGFEVRIVQKLDEGYQVRDRFDILLRNYEVETEGKPEVPQPYSGTQYQDWNWLDVEELRETAENGNSLCVSLLLDLHGSEFEMPANIERDSIRHFRANFDNVKLIYTPQMQPEQVRAASWQDEELPQFGFDPN